MHSVPEVLTLKNSSPNLALLRCIKSMKDFVVEVKKKPNCAIAADSAHYSFLLSLSVASHHCARV